MRLRRAFATFVLLAACDKGAPAGGAQADAAPRPSASSRSVQIDPSLVDAGRVRTAPVTKRAATGLVTLPADVVASAEGAAEAGALLPGRVARFELREGDKVKRGQVLAWLDSPEASRAVADLVRARARTEAQARKVTRLEGLVASEAATQAALDEARLESDIARADLAAARTLLASLGLPEPPPTGGAGAVPTFSAQLPIRSPVDGVIVARRAPVGGHVTPETPLFQIVSEGRVLVEARAPDGAIPAPGTAAQLRTRGGARCAASVLGALPQIDAQTRSRRVRLAPDAACTGLVAGAQIDVELPASTGAPTSSLIIPFASVVEVKTARVVFVAAKSKGTFDVRAVEPGLRVGDDLVVTAGLAEGEEVVVEGTVLLKGELIRAELGGEE